MTSSSLIETTFKITIDEFKKFLNIVKELVKMEDNFKLLFLEKGVLIYSIIAEKTGKINALKVFPISQQSLFMFYPKNLMLKMAFMDGKKFYDKMSFLINEKDNEDIEININHNKDIACMFGGKIKNLDIRATCIDEKIIRDLNHKMLTENLNAENAEISFKLRNDDLTKILKLSKLDNLSELISVKIEDGQIIFYEDQWNLTVSEIKETTKNGIYTMKKEYLKNITIDEKSESFQFSIFDTYIVAETKSYFMFCMELTD